MKIAIGPARGLCFLHDAKNQVIYRDFKASNILLDSGFNAKLSDFGLAREGRKDDRSNVTTEVNWYTRLRSSRISTQVRSTRLNNTSISTWFCLHELTSPILGHCVLETSHYLQWKQQAAVQVHEDTGGSIPLIIIHFNASATTSFAKLQSELCWESSLCFHFYSWSTEDSYFIRRNI